MLAWCFAACVETASEHIKRGDEYLAQGNIDAALAEYNRASEIDTAVEVQSRINRAYGIKLDLLIQASEFNTAIEEGLKTLASSPSEDIRERVADAYIARAWFYKSKRLNPYAIKDLTSAVEIAPRYYRVYYERGRFYNNQWQHNIGLLDLNKAVELKPDHAASYNERAYSYYKSKKYEQALKDSCHALQLNPKEANFYYTRSLIYTAMQEYTLAAADLEQTISLAREDDELAIKAKSDLKALKSTTSQTNR